MQEETKRCGRCAQTLPMDMFHRRGSGHQSLCKRCKAQVDRLRLEENRDRMVTVKVARRREIAAWSADLKRGKPCADCGTSFHPAAMQWDHIGTDKEINIGDTARRGWSRARILKEIAKCELVCANCHAVRTWSRNALQMVEPSAA